MKTQTSQYIFTDEKQKCKLVINDTNWFTCECKNIADDSPWMPYICGTREWLGLSDWEVENSYPPKGRKA